MLLTKIPPVEGQTRAEIRVNLFEHRCIHNEDCAFYSTAPHDHRVTLSASERPFVPVTFSRS